jgi:uncharacterized RDD family membrane protein YckC
MKCPKCQYLSFGTGTRCRNCGYEFALADDSIELDLPIASADEPIGPMRDLPLAGVVAAGRPHQEIGASVSAGAATAGNGSQVPLDAADLPLFTSIGGGDAPLVSAPAVPRPPLAVRRAAPVPPKPRARPHGDDGEPVLDLDDPAAPRFIARARQEASEIPAEDDAPRTAPVLRRLAAALIDTVIIAGIDAAVLYLTLRLSNLQFAQVSVLPKVPFAAFLMLLNGGYLVLFTAAAGQTIGKMAARIRVIPFTGSSSTDRVAFGTAVLRAAAYIASLLPAGLGFVPILFSPDGRTLHDRLADTRVVKA